MTIQMTLRLVRAALVVKVQGNTAVWPRATWILPELTDTSRGHTRPGKIRTPSSSISGEALPVQALQVAPYTCRSWQQHPVVTQLYLTSYFRLRSVTLLLQQIRLLWWGRFYRQMQISSPFTWKHSGFRASEKNGLFRQQRKSRKRSQGVSKK